MIRTRTTIMVLAIASFLSMGPMMAQQTQPVSAAAAQPNLDASGVSHRLPGTTMPKVVTSVNPMYTEAARAEKIKGDCVVALMVDAAGVPQNVRVVRSIAETNPDKERNAALSLDAKAVEAVRQYRFQPAMYEGKAVPVELKIVVNFQIF